MRPCNLHCYNLQSLLILKLSRRRRRVLGFTLVDTCDVHAVVTSSVVIVVHKRS